MKKLFLILVLFSQVALASNYLPNATLTPGANNPIAIRNVTVKQLCSTSTKTVRDVDFDLHNQIYLEYKLTGNHTGYCKDKKASKDEGCEIDHLCSLELGCNNDAKNLWPQPYFGLCNAHQKDDLENTLHKMICDGKINMKQAQKEISTDWVKAYSKYVNSKGCNNVVK